MRSILVINTRYPLENCIVLRFEQSIKFYLFSLSLSLLLSPFVLSPLFLERERVRISVYIHLVDETLGGLR